MHVDIWGHTKFLIVNGDKYLTIVDDYSRYTWLFLLNDKGSARIKLQHFYAYIENQFKTTVKIIRIYNGFEFKDAFFLLSKA